MKITVVHEEVVNTIKVHTPDYEYMDALSNTYEVVA